MALNLTDPVQLSAHARLRMSQRKVTYDYIMRIREAMRRVMEELEIPPSEPHSGAVRAAAINLMFCSISLNELTPAPPDH